MAWPLAVTFAARLMVAGSVKAALFAGEVRAMVGGNWLVTVTLAAVEATVVPESYTACAVRL